jgi:hypothetical protein
VWVTLDGIEWLDSWKESDELEVLLDNSTNVNNVKWIFVYCLGNIIDYQLFIGYRARDNLGIKLFNEWGKFID